VLGELPELSKSPSGPVEGLDDVVKVWRVHQAMVCALLGPPALAYLPCHEGAQDPPPLGQAVTREI
jgi:hypothetical protein